MIGNNLMVEIPWIVFAVLLAAVCVRLCRYRRFSDRQQDAESRQHSEDGGDSAAVQTSAREPGRDDHGWPAVSLSAQSASPASSNQDAESMAVSRRPSAPSSIGAEEPGMTEIPAPRQPLDSDLPRSCQSGVSEADAR